MNRTKLILLIMFVFATLYCKTPSTSNTEAAKTDHFQLCQSDSMEIIDGFFMVGIQNKELDSKLKLNGSTNYADELRKILRKEFKEILHENRISEFDIIIVVGSNDNLIDVVNMSSIAQVDKLSDLRKDSKENRKEVNQYWADIFGLIDENETEKMYKTIRQQRWVSAKCNGRKVRARAWITVNLN